jgi:hypothetical protein
MDILRRIGLFNWRMAATADLDKRIKSWQEMESSNITIERLGLPRDVKLMDWKLAQKVQAVIDIAKHSHRTELSAFHIEAGMN